MARVVAARGMRIKLRIPFSSDGVLPAVLRPAKPDNKGGGFEGKVAKRPRLGAADAATKALGLN